MGVIMTHVYSLLTVREKQAPRDTIKGLPRYVRAPIRCRHCFLTLFVGKNFESLRWRYQVLLVKQKDRSSAWHYFLKFSIVWIAPFFSLSSGTECAKGPDKNKAVGDVESSLRGKVLSRKWFNKQCGLACLLQSLRPAILVCCEFH